MLSQAPESTVAVIMGWCTLIPLRVSPSGNSEKFAFILNLGPVILFTCCVEFSELSVGLTPGKSAPENPASADQTSSLLAVWSEVVGFQGLVHQWACKARRGSHDTLCRLSTSEARPRKGQLAVRPGLGLLLGSLA